MIQGARIAGASPIVAVDVVPAKLELAKDLGATDVVLSGEDVADGRALEDLPTLVDVSPAWGAWTTLVAAGDQPDVEGA